MSTAVRVQVSTVAVPVASAVQANQTSLSMALLPNARQIASV